MSKKTNSKQKGNKAAVAVMVVAVLVALILAAYVILSLVYHAWNPARWTDTKHNPPAEIIGVSSDGEALREGCTYEMPAGITFFSAREAVGDNEFVQGSKLILTPTLSNEYINGVFDWSVEYEYEHNGDSLPPDVSVGGAADTRISVVSKDEGREAEVYYNSRFNAPIILTVKLRGTASEATCLLSCMKDVFVESNTLSMETMSEDILVTTEFNVSNNGIVFGDLALTSFSVSLTDDFKTEIQKYLKFPLTFTSGDYSFSNSPLSVPEGERDNILRGISYDFYIDGDNLKYSDFIEGFDSYDQVHKDAIYFAWHYAVNNGSVSHNVAVYSEYRHSYLGHTIDDFSYDSENSLIDIAWQIQDTVTPNVTLNGNYVFG